MDFTIKLHFGGKFIRNPGWIYKGGSVDYIDFCDGDEFSVHELDDMVGALGLNYDKSPLFYQFTVPGKTQEDGVFPLRSDQDVLHVLKYVKDHKQIEVYINHTKNCLNNSLFSHGKSSGVVIEDLPSKVNPSPLFVRHSKKLEPRRPCTSKSVMLHYHDKGTHVQGEVDAARGTFDGSLVLDAYDLNNVPKETC